MMVPFPDSETVPGNFPHSIPPSLPEDVGDFEPWGNYESMEVQVYMLFSALGRDFPLFSPRGQQQQQQQQ
jgi:hypothetical protein